MNDAADASAQVTAEKNRLRAVLVAARAARSAASLEAARSAVRAAVLERVRADGWTCVAAYVPLRTEPGSRELLTDLAACDVRVLVPVTLADRDLDWTEWGADGVGPPLGLAAIGAADAVLVPALAVAADGTRLGRGGGSYDRALARCAPGTPRAALLFDDELLATLPGQPWDQPVTDVVQPSGWTTLRSATA